MTSPQLNRGDENCPELNGSYLITKGNSKWTNFGSISGTHTHAHTRHTKLFADYEHYRGNYVKSSGRVHIVSFQGKLWRFETHMKRWARRAQVLVLP